MRWTQADKRTWQDLLRGVRDAITAAGQTTVEAIGENTEAYQRAHEPKPAGPPERVSVEVNLSPEEAKRYYSEQDKTYRLQRRTFWATVATFIAVAAYAVITLLQWRTMNATYGEIQKQTKAATDSAQAAKDAVSQARDNFTADQRPWIFTNAIIPEPGTPRDANQRFMFGVRMFWRIYFSNYGRSPAIKIRGSFRLFHGRHAMEDADKFFASLPKYFPEGEHGDSALPPGGPPSPRPIVPGAAPEEIGQRFATVFSENILTPAEIDFIYRHDLAIMVVGRLQYRGTSGNEIYWTDFCTSTFITGAINNCGGRHNDAH